MAMPTTRPPMRRRRPRSARALGALLLGAAVAAAAVTVRRRSASLGFALGVTGRGAPHWARLTAGAPFGSRLPRASRGGEASEGFQVGDKVQAISPDDEQRYPGTVEGMNDDGTFTVRWDDPDGGPETNDIEPALMKKVIIFRDYVVGDDVKAISPDDGQWYLGSVAAVNADGTFQVKWDDPYGRPETHAVQAEGMKKVTVFKDYKAGEAVEAVYPDDGQMYAGSVLKANDDGTFQVKWDDPDGGPADSAVKAKDMRYPPIPFDKLEVGQKYSGTVRRIRDFGAFVDFGADGDGMVHVSKISEERVNNLRDYLEEGQEVEVWVSELRGDGKVSLTMVESKIGGSGGPRAPADLSAFAGVSSDEWLDGTVARLAPFGAFVSVSLPGGGASADGLVHVSQIKDGFVESVEDELEVGQEVKVRVDSVDAERGRLGLSMRGPREGGGAAARGPVDLTPFEGLPQDQWITGTVARTAPFGAFVTVKAEDGMEADGLVHITQIKDGFVESVEAELEPGQEVQVRVVSVDTGAGKMGLSMKPPEDE